MKIKYVGTKEGGETAFSHVSGIALWLAGDVHEIRDDVAKKMLEHPDVFALDVPDAGQVASTGKTQADGAQGLQKTTEQSTQKSGDVISIAANGEVIALNGLTKAQLHELAKRLDVKVHQASGADKVVEALQAAFPG